MSSHLSIEAGAGTGKTTTIVEGARLALGGQSQFKPSAQQAAIWDHLRTLITPSTTCRFMAFNKSIATELASRLPSGIEASTFHGYGFKALMKPLQFPQLDEGGRVKKLLEKQFRIDPRKDADFLYPFLDLVSLCKLSLTDPEDRDAVENLIDHHNIALNGSTPRALDLLPRVIDWCARCPDRLIDYDDMVWLPIVRNLSLPRTDVLLVDERQDLNRVQQELCLRSADRLVAVGDPRQAIYGFAGADANAFARLSAILAATEAGLTELPLMQTRRCPRTVVEAVRHLAPGFEALPEAPEGQVQRDVPWSVLLGDKSHPTMDKPTPGDMVLCRTNAPLVSLCYSYLRRSIPAQIQGRKIGTGLAALVRKSKAKTIPDLVRWVDAYRQAETDRIMARAKSSETALSNLEDKVTCVHYLCEGQATPDDVLRRIETLFSDKSPTGSIRLSSVHKAKGLEADRVWIARPEILPAPWARLDWEKVQERNLEYVAYTRAKHSLALVPGPKDKTSDE